MLKSKSLIIGVLFCMLLAACSGNSNTGNPGTDPDNEPQDTPVQSIKSGTIMQKTGNSWLVASYMEKDGGDYIDAYSFTVTDSTLLQGSDGEEIPSEQLAAGAQVEVWGIGPVRESFPAQMDAYRIILLDEPTQDGQEWISRADAVQAALLSQGAPEGVLAIKSAELNAENGYWEIELVAHSDIDEPVAVRIDARSGDAIAETVAENETFRVFSPLPESEHGPVFKVEGEARVFEAAFSWTLEDGHNILAEGNEMTDAGAPEWGKFSFDVSFENASQPHMMLILFNYSSNDGSAENQLIIPLKVPEELIQYSADR